MSDSKCTSHKACRGNLPAMRALDRDDSRPPYVQVADAVQDAIEAGEFQPGDKLPTHAQLVGMHGVSVATVKKALAKLQTAGLIVSRRGEGAFVRTRRAELPAVLQPDDTTSLRKAIEALEARLDRVESLIDKGR